MGLRDDYAAALKALGYHRVHRWLGTKYWVFVKPGQRTPKTRGKSSHRGGVKVYVGQRGALRLGRALAESKVVPLRGRRALLSRSNLWETIR